MTRNCAYSILSSYVKVNKSDSCCLSKVRLDEHQKAVVHGEIENRDMADHIWKEKGNNLPLWDEVGIIDRKEYWRSSIYVRQQ